MKVIEFVKKILDEPDMSDDLADAILWGCTGYPSFFIGDPIRCLAYQLRHAKRALDRGFSFDEIYMGEDKLPQTEDKQTAGE